MSVRATERLVGDVVIVTGLPNSAKMVVQSVNEEEKQAETIWFADDHSVQTGMFPASSLDRAEQKGQAKIKAPAKAKAGKTGTAGRPRGRKK